MPEPESSSFMQEYKDLDDLYEALKPVEDMDDADVEVFLEQVARTKVQRALKTLAADKAKREVTPEQVDLLVSALKSRFELPANEDLRKTLNWEDAEKALRANPGEVLCLEETGGEPQIVGIEGDEFIIEDRSAESPAGRKNLNFDEADVQRASFGPNVRFQSRDSYIAMQKTGTFDLHTASWLETDEATRESGVALFGFRFEDGAYVGKRDALFYKPNYGWRAALRIKRV